MDLIFQLVIVIEIIITNVALFYFNASPKYSILKTVTVIALYTVALIMGGLVLLKQFSFYGNGNALFTMLGFCYLPVFKYLFKEGYHDIFFIICYAWTYTLIVFSISVQVGYLLEAYGRFMVMLLAQTVLFVASYRFVFNFVDNIYVKLLDCKEQEIRDYLDKVTFIWFVTIFLVNLNFIFENVAVLKIIVFIMLFINVVFSYVLLHEILSKGNRIGNLQNQIAKDTLTDVGSRLGFDYYLKEKLHDNFEFVLIYMDLDNFKGINDRYGHLIGDQYLKAFASKLKEQENLNIFRISGDEFILISKLDNYQKVIEKLSQITFKLNEQISFEGVSIGYALFPKEARNIDDLISVADQRMYNNKRAREL